MTTVTRGRSTSIAPLRLSRTRKKVWTEDELANLPDDGKYELVDGELDYMPPAFPEHGKTTFKFGLKIGNFVERRKLGDCFDGQTGFWMKSGNLRSPDISFVSPARAAALKHPDREFFVGAPDLAVETLSGSDRPKRIAEKLRDYFESGARLVWLLDKPSKTVRVHRDPENCITLGPRDMLSGEDVLPGFKIRVAKLFEE